MPLEDPFHDPDLLLKSAFYSARPGMALVNPRGQFMRVNPAFCQIVGYPADELEKLTFQEITHPDDLAYDLEQVGRLVRGEISGYEMEKRYVRKDGSVVWTQLSRAVVRNDSGRPICFPVDLQDLTERKAEEAKLTDELLGRILTEETGGEILDSEPEIRILNVVRALCHEPSLLRQKISEVALTKLLADPLFENESMSKSLLTDREQQILLLVAKGKTSKEIGHTLGTSARTVEVHRASATRKIRTASPADLIRQASTPV